ncbi:uncharacterized protein BDV14DRAFT_170545 [Aspergillus stella-maris]|uniref:uncharacterized protein n=1 Tax=Aspergillus stella-maris TaxID=1810926 RepID=UPI003CCD0E51
MESAPLTLAHTHARNAVLETRKSNPVAASEEHDLAAGEFAIVAQGSRDHEALRTLHLLEQHHKRLAHILRFQHENPSSVAGASKSDSQQPPKLIGNPRLPKRETSSIASNLASARGIPAQPRRSSPASPTLSSQQAGAKMSDGPTKIRTSESSLRGTQRDRVNRTSSQKQPWSPPTASPTEIISQEFVPADTKDTSRQSNRQSITEEPFQRFYSTFEGLITKISAPLAFAGLPLGSDGTNDTSTPRKSSAETRVDRRSAVHDRSNSSTEPDISRIFSRAALKAIRETNGGSGMGTGNAAESFYVVPTTGGTVSYAGILTRAEKEARRNSVDEAEDDFVDARETPSSPEMLQTNRNQGKGKGKGKPTRGNDKLTTLQPAKTLEELQMENQALKHLSDTLSKRLHMWEVNAQSSSMALQQSLKAMHHQNIPSPEHAPHPGSAIPSPTTGLPTPATAAGAGIETGVDSDQRIKELEEMIRRSKKELEQAGRENEKLHGALGRYRDRWEKLKEGAKNRRAEGSARRTSSVGTTPVIEEEGQNGNGKRDSASTEQGSKVDEA